MVDALFSEHASFNQETTLSGRTIMRRIEQAVGLGYRVIMHYVGVESPHIACDRIAHRVSTGGHDIDRAIVRQRYELSMRNLNRAIRLCDEAYLFDNTNELTLTASFYRGKPVLLSEFPRVAWLHAALDGTGLLDGPEKNHVKGRQPSSSAAHVQQRNPGSAPVHGAFRVRIPSVAQRGFGFRPSAQRGFGPCPSRREKRPWMDTPRTLKSQMDKGRTLDARIPAVRTRNAMMPSGGARDAHADGQRPNPGCTDTRRASPKRARTTAERTQCAQTDATWTRNVQTPASRRSRRSTGSCTARSEAAGSDSGWRPSPSKKSLAPRTDTKAPPPAHGNGRGQKGRSQPTTSRSGRQPVGRLRKRPPDSMAAARQGVTLAAA